MGCPPVRKIIHSLKLVDDLHVQADNPWYNYYLSTVSDQTCDKNTSCPFSHLLDLADTDLLICKEVFKINPQDVRNSIRFTNDYYGANNTQQSKIVFVNGK